jgi:hypothetical protein
MTIPLTFSYFDDTVEVALRAATYRYGAGRPGVGVQVTLDAEHTPGVVAIRLPAYDARRLAVAILAAVDPEEKPDA